MNELNNLNDAIVDPTELEEYQDFVEEHTMFYDTDWSKNILWALAGLTAELGEVAGAIEKELRVHGFVRVTALDTLSDELGDVLFFYVALTNSLGLVLDDIMLGNIEKLTERRQNNYVPKTPAE